MRMTSRIAVMLTGLSIVGLYSVAAAYQSPPPPLPAPGNPMAAPNGMSQPATSAPAPSSSVPSMPGMSQPSGAASSATPESGSQRESNCCPGPRMVESTICVPVFAYEKRMVPCVEYSTEQRQQPVTVMHAVPEKKTITREYVVMVPETRTRTESYVVCKPVPCDGCGCCGCKYEQETKQREVQYTVCVPHTKECTYDVTVCNYVPEQRSVTVNVCVPHMAQKEVSVCVCHMVTKKVLVPVPTCCMPCCGPPCCGGCGYGWGPGYW